MFCFNFLLQKIFARLTLIFFSLFSSETVREVFLFQTVGRVIVPDIIFRDRTCLVFWCLGYLVKFQAREANSWPRSASLNPGNRVCLLFVFLSFFSFSFPSYF